MNIEEGALVSIEWIDGDFVESCLFIRKERGFLLFLFDGKIIVARNGSIKEIKEIENE